ncbi:MAG: hypothetical protein RIQ47_418, partial [Bacteroidota bacterium]
MKKSFLTFRSLVILALAAISFTACVKE